MQLLILWHAEVPICIVVEDVVIAILQELIALNAAYREYNSEEDNVPLM